nr:immunoglobulin heavy chain junction region [Macaca mulatta]
CAKVAFGTKVFW